MSPREAPRGGNRLLAFFGLDTGRNAAETALWTAPYLLTLGVAFAGLTALTHSFLGVPLWTYGVAGFLGLAHLFLFLARLRKLATQSDRGDA